MEKKLDEAKLEAFWEEVDRYTLACSGPVSHLKIKQMADAQGALRKALDALVGGQFELEEALYSAAVGVLDLKEPPPALEIVERLQGALKKGCRIGVYCDDHKFIHGAEAEELRETFEGLAQDEPDQHRDIQRVLDKVDARDSLAYSEQRKAIQRKATPRVGR